MSGGGGEGRGGGRRIDAGLSLLDRQILDRDGRLSGKVDDLELTVPEGPEGGPPVVTAILAGPGALARRLRGSLGAWLESVHSRLHPSVGAGPARIPFGVVKEIAATVGLSVAKGDLELSRFEEWTRDHLIGRIPGAGHAPE